MILTFNTSSLCGLEVLRQDLDLEGLLGRRGSASETHGLHLLLHAGVQRVNVVWITRFNPSRPLLFRHHRFGIRRGIIGHSHLGIRHANETRVELVVVRFLGLA